MQIETASNSRLPPTKLSERRKNLPPRLNLVPTELQLQPGKSDPVKVILFSPPSAAPKLTHPPTIEESFSPRPVTVKRHEYSSTPVVIIVVAGIIFGGLAFYLNQHSKLLSLWAFQKNHT